MNAQLQEIKDGNGNTYIAVIGVIVAPADVAAMNYARVRLNDFITNYVGKRLHNVYMHTENDTVSAVITFDLNNYPGQAISI
jgi:hypothetical protein